MKRRRAGGSNPLPELIMNQSTLGCKSRQAAADEAKALEDADPATDDAKALEDTDPPHPAFRANPGRKSGVTKKDVGMLERTPGFSPGLRQKADLIAFSTLA